MGTGTGKVGMGTGKVGMDTGGKGGKATEGAGGGASIFSPPSCSAMSAAVQHLM